MSIPRNYISPQQIVTISVSISTSLFIALLSIYILARRKILYPNGKYPSIAPKMYGFCIAYGFSHVGICTTLLSYFAHTNNHVLVLHLLFVGLGEVAFMTLFCYHAITWLSLVYVDRLGKNYKEKIQRWKIASYVLTTILVLLGTIGRITALVVHPNDDASHLKMVQVGFLALAIPCLVTSLAYLFCWKQLVGLVNATKMDSTKKAYRIQKLTRLILIFIGCLIVHSAYYIVCSVKPELSKLNTHSLLLLFMYVLPEVVAELTTMYYFSPLDSYNLLQHTNSKASLQSTESVMKLKIKDSASSSSDHSGRMLSSESFGSVGSPALADSLSGNSSGVLSSVDVDVEIGSPAGMSP